MKGPRSRHRYNVQRVWECPACKKRVFAPPRVTSRACPCQGAERPTWMVLIEIDSNRFKPAARSSNE